jgi:hypothetical protein
MYGKNFCTCPEADHRVLAPNNVSGRVTMMLTDHFKLHFTVTDTVSLFSTVIVAGVDGRKFA